MLSEVNVRLTKWYLLQDWKQRMVAASDQRGCDTAVAGGARPGGRVSNQLDPQIRNRAGSAMEERDVLGATSKASGRVVSTIAGVI